jgi:hypothetical protein
LKIGTLNCSLILLLVAAFFTTIPLSRAESNSQDVALQFIENAFPADTSKYSISLTKYVEMKPADTVDYTLQSDNSIIVVSCNIRNNILTNCIITTKSGQNISERLYSNLDFINAAKDFLNKYQNYTKIESSNIIKTLDDFDGIDVTKNSSKIIGNTKFAIDNFEEWGYKTVKFSWTYTVNDADYTSLSIRFREGVFYALNDDRGLYTIGDTTVNISQDQAIEIAMKKIETYSYDMFNDTKISGFNITSDRTVAELTTTPRNASVLNPRWTVKLYLNQTYPGSVIGFLIHIWAKSGEVYAVNEIAIGDASSINSYSNEPKETNPVPTNNANSAFSNIPIIAATTATIILILMVIIAIMRKK